MRVKSTLKCAKGALKCATGPVHKFTLFSEMYSGLHTKLKELSPRVSTYNTFTARNPGTPLGLEGHARRGGFQIKLSTSSRREVLHTIIKLCTLALSVGVEMDSAQKCRVGAIRITAKHKLRFIL